MVRSKRLPQIWSNERWDHHGSLVSGSNKKSAQYVHNTNTCFTRLINNEVFIVLYGPALLFCFLG
jgi:hypothetical protein